LCCGDPLEVGEVVTITCSSSPHQHRHAVITELKYWGSCFSLVRYIPQLDIVAVVLEDRTTSFLVSRNSIRRVEN
jgi:hypothetical protein